MKELGEYLKRIRMGNGVSLTEACEDLEISTSHLENIESGNVRAFKDVYELREIIKSYAKYLGLEPEKVVDEFNDFLFQHTSKISLDDIRNAQKKKEQEESVKKVKSPYTLEYKEKFNFWPIIYFFIGIILIVICSIKQMRKTYDFLLQITNKINEKQIVFISLLIVILCNCLWWFSYFIFNNVVKYTNLIITSSILNLASVLLVLFYLKVNNKYLSMSEKYNYSLQSIREFELMIENYKINTHENKNQFRTIRNMSKNKKINSYIDALLDESITDDEKVLMDIQRIPAGGLRGIIYSKLLLMHQKNISTELVIDKKITSAKVNNIDDYTLTAICRILGVLLDNAIEGVNNLENKYIMVELYEEDKELVISITNNYEGYVDVGSINQPGISSKGKEHGYGLTLVQRLVKKNKKIQHRSEFFEDNFMQKIKIKV